MNQIFVDVSKLMAAGMCIFYRAVYICGAVFNFLHRVVNLFPLLSMHKCIIPFIELLCHRGITDT